MEENEQRKLLEMQDSEEISFCLSFNSYSAGRFIEVASKVIEEFRSEEQHPLESSNLDDGFEFACVRSDNDLTSDEIFHDGQIHPVFPIFNRDLLINYDQDQHRDRKADASARRPPLKKLFAEELLERDLGPQSLLPAADDLEGITPGTYCVWRPQLVGASASRRKMSNSKGSASKLWKFRDLLHRSNSEGKDAFVLLTPKDREEKTEEIERVENSKERPCSGNSVKAAGMMKTKGVADQGKTALLNQKALHRTNTTFWFD